MSPEKPTDQYQLAPAGTSGMVQFMPEFTPETAAAAARKGHKARGGNNGLRQAIRLQNLCYQAAVSLEGKIENAKGSIAREDAQALTALVKAWESCQERIRIHRGKPMPGSLRPNTKPSNARVGQVPPARSRFRDCGAEPLLSGVPSGTTLEVSDAA